MQIFLVSFLLFFLPFIIFPFGPSPFETPKILVFESLTFILLLYSLFRVKFRIEYFRTLPFILITGIIALSLFHLFFLSTKTTFLGNPFRLQGIFLTWVLLTFSFLSSFLNIARLNKNFYFASFISLFITTIILGTNEAGRAVGPLGEPNALAATALLLFPFIFFSSWLHTRCVDSNVVIKILGVLGVLFIVFLSGSRSGLIGFLIQLVFIGLIWIRNHGTNPPATQAKLLALRAGQNPTQNYSENLSRIVLISFFFISLSLTLPFLEGGGVYENRADIWKTAFLAGLNSPVVGNGFGNIEQSFRETAIKTSNNAQFQYVDSSHNLILDWWVQGGIIGIGILTLLIIHSLKNLVKEQKILETTALLGVLTTMLFNPASIVVLIYFWFLIGQRIINDKKNMLDSN